MTYDEAFTRQRQQREEIMGMSKKKSEEYSYQRDFVVIDMLLFRQRNKIVYI